MQGLTNSKGLFFTGVAETMHPQRPLIAHDRSLHPREDQDAHQRRRRKPERNGDDQRRVRQDLVRKENAGSDDVADNKEGEISGRVVCALPAQVLMANRASRSDPKVGSEHRPLAAVGTAAEEAAPKGQSKVAASA